MKIYLLVLTVLLLASACSDEPVETKYFNIDTGNGVFIACEGNFMYGNGSLSFYHKANKKVTNQLFYARNNIPLGDVVLSVSRYDDLLFIVVNNSGKIMITDANTIEYKGSITGLVSPRYVHFVSGQKAYVSDLYSGHISVVNPQTFAVTGNIRLEGQSSEQMVQLGKYVYVSQWSYGNKVLIIDTETDTMVGEIQVPLQPKELRIDRNGKIWIFSDGGYEGSPQGDERAAISRIDPETQTIEQVYRFSAGESPSGMEINREGDTIFFINNHIFKMHIGSRHLPDSAFIRNDGKLFYHLAIDPDNNDIYIADAIDYTQNSVIYRFTQGGEALDTFKAGINPSNFMFR